MFSFEGHGLVTNEVPPCEPMSSSLNSSLDGSSTDIASLFPNIPTSPGGLSPLSMNHQAMIAAGQPILNPGTQLKIAQVVPCNNTVIMAEQCR